jgi:hypothetical protein
MAIPVDETTLRTLVTKHLELDGIVSHDEAMCLIETLIKKDSDGQLRQPEIHFLRTLKEAGLVEG